jgi:hypothetical protein
VQGYRRSPALWVATLAEQGKQLQDLVLDVSAAVKTCFQEHSGDGEGYAIAEASEDQARKV